MALSTLPNFKLLDISFCDSIEEDKVSVNLIMSFIASNKNRIFR